MNLNKDDSGFFIDATLNAELNGVDQQQAEALVAKAHTICPYSKATRGNIEVKLQANGKARADRRRKRQKYGHFRKHACASHRVEPLSVGTWPEHSIAC